MTHLLSETYFHWFSHRKWLMYAGANRMFFQPQLKLWTRPFKWPCFIWLRMIPLVTWPPLT